MSVERVSIYRAPTTVADADAIEEWLAERIGGRVEVRDRFLRTDGDDSLAEAFAAARVRSPGERETGNTMLGAVRYEERAMAEPERAGGVLYDGIALRLAFNDALPVGERGLDHAHVVLLDRAIATWGDHDARWHKRVVVPGQPSIVSVPGLYEAPAKPEAYYREKERHALLSGGAPPREVLENEVEGEFLIASDPRTTDALKGYALAAVHFLETGEAFCPEEGCRLYDAHYQEDLIEAQLREPEFCPDHADRYGGG
ncbi:DUF7001 family protein [Saliphagus infecundisoli]|uniref:DUF7001 family protein n=1 Tax=Saliphagus infecundisoli TaxID=1849069 RepID=A0ABD5QIG1_9EURY|nr:DUF6775 family putative metallopeptidase [Saliphagus infecundisoli]